MSAHRETYEVFVSRASLDELRKGHANVIMGVMARPRNIIGDQTAVLATLTVVEIRDGTSQLPPGAEDGGAG